MKNIIKARRKFKEGDKKREEIYIEDVRIDSKKLEGFPPVIKSILKKYDLWFSRENYKGIKEKKFKKIKFRHERKKIEGKDITSG